MTVWSIMHRIVDKMSHQVQLHGMMVLEEPQNHAGLADIPSTREYFARVMNVN
jgi:hypothetical protein